MANQRKTLGELGFAVHTSLVVTGIAIDNRAVKEGDLFAALPGTNVHGARFAADAVDAGAVAILTDPDGVAELKTTVDGGFPIIVTTDVRAALSRAAALFYGAQPQTMVAVTGTNGKTSVSNFCRQIWNELELSAVNIGTTGVEGDWTHPLRHTTPDPITLHSILAQAAEHGVTHAAMEASSHGLDQRRLEGVSLVAAGFTNFTQDHLDYHHSFDDYFAAKARLFEKLLPMDGTAVINTDDPKLGIYASDLTMLGYSLITIGTNVANDIYISDQRYDATGQTVRFAYKGKTYVKRLNLIGGFQAENVLMAAALVIAAGSEPQHVFDTFEHLVTVRGRMQFAATRANGASVFVDYAHTPDAVETAVSAFRPHVMGRLIAIIGAGGDRDKTKRPLMARAAVDRADYVIVTDDNPRSEDPADIRAQVMAGAQGCDTIIEVGDRAEAILRAVNMLEPGDGLLITGKGHETGQIVGHDVLPFDDVEQASVAVAALDGMI
jgi:UDP-N-acetylmuramoyl-L-alanyl-D-glutamate--2,6-diaminopimelate ligase